MKTRLKVCDLKLCEAMCCHDGVYLMNRDEEQAINFVVQSFPSFFAEILPHPLS